MPTIIETALSASPQELRDQFATLSSRRDVARLLEIPDPLLCHILYGRRERRRYRKFEIPKKSGGVRIIHAPPRNINILHRKLLGIFELVYSPRDCVTGFVSHRGIIENATPHVARRVLLNIDIEDFFPSIHIGRIAGLFSKPPYSVGEAAATVLAQILTIDLGVSARLPQGACTSPIVANMVATPLDTELIRLCRNCRATYTRYADDLTFSTTRRDLDKRLASEDEAGLVVLGDELLAAFEKHSFRINATKTRLRTARQRQRVTGLVTNESVNVPRAFVRETRQLLYYVEKWGAESAGLKYAGKRGVSRPEDPAQWIIEVIRGRVAFIAMVRGKDDFVYRKFAIACNRLSQGICRVPDISSTQCPLPNTRIRNPRWDRWVTRYSESVWQLECCSTMSQGQVGWGTCFYVGGGRVFTAGHNCVERLPSGATTIRRLTVWVTDTSSFDAVCLGAENDPRKRLDFGVLMVDALRDRLIRPIPMQERLPMIGEEVFAMGYPSVPGSSPVLACHAGRVELIGSGYTGWPVITVSFPSDRGLSGGPLLDASGYCVGVMIENSFLRRKDRSRDLDGTEHTSEVARRPPIGSDADSEQSFPERLYGHAVPIGLWREVVRAPQT